MMGDMGDMYRDFNEIKKDRKAVRQKKNMAIFEDWLKQDEDRRFSVELREYSVLFRFPGKPKADFFLTTNKWRSRGRTYYGDAKRFLEWHGRR